MKKSSQSNPSELITIRLRFCTSRDGGVASPKQQDAEFQPFWETPSDEALPFAGEKTLRVRSGTLLTDLCDLLGISIPKPCGGGGTCGKCQVFITEKMGSSPNEHPSELSSVWRSVLACKTYLTTPTEILIPNFGNEAELAIAAPTVTGKKGTHGKYAVAVDVGTTTLAASLLRLDLATQNEGRLAVATALNPQVKFGADVIARIQKIRDDFATLEQMHLLLWEKLREMLAELEKKSHVKQTDISSLLLTGNTTMLQIALGIDPRGLGEAPYQASISGSEQRSAKDFGLQLAPYAEVRTVPVLAGFLGGDILCGIIATPLATLPQEPTMLVDIGSNGEIALACEGKLLAASTAAGPALEGAKIKHGMRAAPGAIARVEVRDEQFIVETIGAAPPIGICGSGLFDAVATLHQQGAITNTGRLQPPVEANTPLAKEITNRFNGDEFSLAGQKVTLTQKDVREFQLAQGALRTGIELLAKKAETNVGNLKKLYLAGGFGNTIHPHSAARTGMLAGLRNYEECVEFVGNTALHGAELMLTNPLLFTKVEELAAHCECVELASEPNFSQIFAETMILPG